MGIVRAYQKGTLKGKATPEVQGAASSMKKKDVKKFASTKHKGLPEKKVTKESVNEDAKMAKQSDDKLKAAHTKFSGMDKSPANTFMLKRIQREMNKRKKNVVKEDYVKELEDGLVKMDYPSYDEVDKLMCKIAKENEIDTTTLHMAFKTKHLMVPDDWAKRKMMEPVIIPKTPQITGDVDEAVNAAQQAAIAMSKKERLLNLMVAKKKKLKEASFEINPAKHQSKTQKIEKMSKIGGPEGEVAKKKLELAKSKQPNLPKLNTEENINELSGDLASKAFKAANKKFQYADSNKERSKRAEQGVKFAVYANKKYKELNANKASLNKTFNQPSAKKETNEEATSPFTTPALQRKKKIEDYKKNADRVLRPKNNKPDAVKEGNLHKWFKGSKSKDGKGGWVNVVTGGTCASDEPGEGTPKCVSSSKRASMTKAERASASRRKKKADPNQQSKSGAAKPTYVATDKKKKKVSEEFGKMSKEQEAIYSGEKAGTLKKTKKVKKNLSTFEGDDKTPNNLMGEAKVTTNYNRNTSLPIGNRGSTPSETSATMQGVNNKKASQTGMVTGSDHPDKTKKKVQLIQSSNAGIVGVGESSTEHISDFCVFVGIDLLDLVKKKWLTYFENTKCQGLHIHCPEGSISKDGPSAGAAITTAIFSLLNEKKIKNNIAITGEINLNGDIMAIGGLETKINGGA